VIPEEVRRYAEDPSAWGPEPAPGSGFARVLDERFCILFGPVPSFTSVSRVRLAGHDVAAAVADVRAHAAERGHRDCLWWVGSSATPDDAVERLRTEGLVPDERPGSEPHATSMVLVSEPPPAPPGVEARRVASLDEYRLANRIATEAFGEPPESHAEWEAVAEERFAAERRGHAPRTYLALVDGEPVAVARGLFEDGVPAILMIGGGVLPHARGRGVYRALVRARWDDAVAAGTPALCTHAGALSRPILERSGFVAVSETTLLFDPETA
jgi:hypothetical protein